jgi:hypothetical protein
MDGAATGHLDTQAVAGRVALIVLFLFASAGGASDGGVHGDAYRRYAQRTGRFLPGIGRFAA